MERIWSTELAARAGQKVQLAGWLHRFRRLSQVSFVVLRDGKGLAQVVVEDAEQVDELARLPTETVLRVAGTAVLVAAAPGGVEVHQPSFEVVSVPVESPPIDLFRPVLNAQLPTILDHAAIALRHPRFRAIHRIAAASAEGYRRTLRTHEFVEIFTPKLVASATEGGANVCAVDYFGRQAFLAQSPQFYKQIMVGVYERVFEVGPVFRAEPHDTPRHLNEFVSFDFEMGFIKDHRTVMAMLTNVLRGMLEAVREEAAEALGQLQVTLPAVPAEIPVIHFVDALRLISDSTGEDVMAEPDLAPAHERWLDTWARRTHQSDFLFVVGYPMAKRPFYTHPQPSRPTHSNSFDLLFRGLELVTGGQRLHRHEEYMAALAERGLPAEPFSGYLEAFAHGMPPHGGCALSLERWVARLVGAANIRETALFPRDINRLSP
ncbi:MAG: aspartate--tRNA(Asn) ligase [Chloroflexota bacterium]